MIVASQLHMFVIAVAHDADGPTYNGWLAWHGGQMMGEVQFRPGPNQKSVGEHRDLAVIRNAREGGTNDGQHRTARCLGLAAFPP